MVASRRQIDYHSGYVNNWRTSSFVHYVRDKNENILICRDHAGPLQGSSIDDGMSSLLVDSIYWNIIHIDPFKYHDLHGSIKYTANAIKECCVKKPFPIPYFEIGTEEAIFPLDDDDLHYFLKKLKKLIPNEFDNIIYGVIQSGTSLKSGVNTGEYDDVKLSAMVNVCRSFNILSKEHNGDYQTPEQIKDKFRLGLSAINIAPEVAHIETEYIIENISQEKIDTWFNLCLNNGSWKKWFPDDFDPYSDPKKVLRLCGHYVFTYPQFIDIFDLSLASEHVTKQIHKFINERI
jgi:hypothetical protein